MHVYWVFKTITKHYNLQWGSHRKSAQNTVKHNVFHTKGRYREILSIYIYITIIIVVIIYIYILGITFRPVSDVSRRTSKSEKVHFFEFEKSRKSILEFEKSRKLIFLNSRNQENRLFHFREIPKKSTFWSSRNPKNCRFWKSRNPKKKHTHTHTNPPSADAPPQRLRKCAAALV